MPQKEQRFFYTVDGSEPTASGTEYKSPISVTAAVTIKAIAIKDGLNNSAVANASYTVKGTVAMPVFNVKSGVPLVSVFKNYFF